MVITKGRLNREGIISIGDASIRIMEEGIPRDCNKREKWESAFKKQVFARIVQTLNRIGWECVIPEKDIEQYGMKFARNRRYCVKGDLKGDLSLSGRCIEFKMFQNVNAPDRPDHEGRYQFDKEEVMPHLLRLEMERTRQRISSYLCNVFTGYTLKLKDKPVGPGGVTAHEWIKQDVRKCWHYKEDIDRRGGEHSHYNNKSADSSIVKHGSRVWFFDNKGRMQTGITHYNINNMWWVITGRYDRRNKASFHLYTSFPGKPRKKRNRDLREKRLKSLMEKAVEEMNFERALLLRNLLYPTWNQK